MDKNEKFNWNYLQNGLWETIVENNWILNYVNVKKTESVVSI